MRRSRAQARLASFDAFERSPLPLMHRDKKLKSVMCRENRNRNKLRYRGSLLAVVAMMVAFICGCSGSAQPKPAAPSAPEVSVAEVVCKQLGDSDEFTGRLEAVHVVEVRPRVSGFLQKVNFKEGEIVRQGDILFEI